MIARCYGVVKTKEEAETLRRKSLGRDDFPISLDTPCILYQLKDKQYLQITKKDIADLLAS